LFCCKFVSHTVVRQHCIDQIQHENIEEQEVCLDGVHAIKYFSKKSESP
jgi:hypothetical protein